MQPHDVVQSCIATKLVKHYSSPLLVVQVKAERYANTSSMEEMRRQSIEFLAQKDATEEVITTSEKTTINHETVTKKKYK